MIWWYWVLLGLLLLGTEMVTPGGFYILFFGLAALIVGGLTGIGFVQEEWLQWLMFSGLAILSLLAFRSSLLAWMNRRNGNLPPMDTLAGEQATPLEDLAAGGTGKAELRGTVWTAHNAGLTPLLKHQRCKVDRVEGLTLWITAA